MKNSAVIGQHIKAVLFDHDDTLVDTIKAKWAQHKYIALNFYNKELLDDEIKQHWGKPLTTLLGLLYGTDDIEKAIKHSKLHNKKFPKALHDDTLTTIKALKKSGKKVGVITATSHFSLSHDLESLGISRKLFDYVQTEEDTKHHKPDHRVFKPTIEWLEQHSIQPHETLYVGDGLHDMKAALGAGFEFVGVTTGLTTLKDFSLNDARAINRLKELIADQS